MRKNNLYLLIIILLLLSFSIYFYKKSIETNNNYENYKKLYENEITQWKDKDSLNHLKINNLIFKSEKDFLEIKSKDNQIKHLQDLVKKHKNKVGDDNTGVANIKTELIYDTVLILREDSMLSGIKYSTVKNKWIEAKYGFKKDSSFFNLKIYDDIDIIFGKEKKGLFGIKKENYVEIINNNPYTATNSSRFIMFNNNVGLKRFGIGISSGITLNNNFRPVPYIGIGINYNIISF